MDDAKLTDLLEVAFRAGYAANTGCPPDCKPATQAWNRFIVNIKILADLTISLDKVSRIR